MRRLLLFAPVLLLLAAIVHAGELPVLPGEAEEYPMDPGDLGIPTTNWGGKRWANGRMSVLVFYDEHIWRQQLRSVVEFQQAFDAEVEYIHCCSDANRVPDNDRARRLLDARQWDVIVFWAIKSWRSLYDYPNLDDDVRYRILRQVADGTGLVMTDRPPQSLCRKDRIVATPHDVLVGGLGLTGRATRDADYFAEYWPKNPELKDEAAFRQGFFQTWQIGQGRAVAYGDKRFLVEQEDRHSHRYARPWTYDLRIDPDYMLAELGRAVLWAARREAKVSFLASPPALMELVWDDAAGKTATWRWAVAGDPRDLAVSWRLRDRRGKVVAEDRKTLSGATGEVKVVATLPQLGAGYYMLDVFVDGPDGRENYGYSGVKVAAPWNVALTPAKVGSEIGEPYAGAVSLAPVEGAPEIERIELRLLDWDDRIVARRELRPEGELRYRLASHANDSIRMVVEAEAFAQGRRLGIGVAEHNLLKRRHDRFNVLTWGNVGGVYRHYGRRKLWRTGVTVAMERNSERYNINYSPFIAGRNQWIGELAGEELKYSLHEACKPKPDEKTGLSLQQPFSWNDERFEQVLALQDRHFRMGQETPVFTYNLYDEGPHSGCDVSPAGLAAYRAWLREQYGGDLARLNLEWQSEYQNWDEVTLLDLKDNLETGARDQGLFARWSDRRHFAEVNFSRAILGGLMRRGRAIDPQALVGFEGSGGFGMDLDELLDHAGFWCPYDGIQTEMVRSLKPEGFIHAFWIGYQKQADPLVARTWRMVINGAPSVWWWMLKGRGRFHGWFASNDMPYPEGEKFLEECILPLRRGLGDLLMRMPQPHDGIAIYYSVATSHAGEIGESAQWNSTRGAHEAMVRIIEDCGFQWIYTTKRRLLDGDLDRRGIKLLVLPFQQPLGEDEVAALKAFVERGGTLVADLRPGVMSGRCRPLASGPADELFGITRTGPGKPGKVAGEFTAELGGVPIPVMLRNNHGDSEMTPASATAATTLEEVPVFLVNSVGKGRTVLLNFHLTQYVGEREMRRGQAQRDLFRGLAQAAGVVPRLVTDDGQGGELQRTEVVTWTRGNVNLHCLYRDGGDETAARVRLPAKAHVFDLRTGADVEADEHRVAQLRPGYAHFFAAYPYDPGHPVATVDQPSAAGGETITVRLRMSGVPADETGIFSFHTRLLDPDGNWCDSIPWSTQGDGSGAEIQVRFAHNDPAGTWQLDAREITTGRTLRVPLNLNRSSRQGRHVQAPAKLAEDTSASGLFPSDIIRAADGPLCGHMVINGGGNWVACLCVPPDCERLAQAGTQTGGLPAHLPMGVNQDSYQPHVTRK